MLREGRVSSVTIVAVGGKWIRYSWGRKWSRKSPLTASYSVTQTIHSSDTVRGWRSAAANKTFAMPLKGSERCFSFSVFLFHLLCLFTGLVVFINHDLHFHLCCILDILLVSLLHFFSCLKVQLKRLSREMPLTDWLIAPSWQLFPSRSPCTFPILQFDDILLPFRSSPSA